MRDPAAPAACSQRHLSPGNVLLTLALNMAYMAIGVAWSLLQLSLASSSYISSELHIPNSTLGSLGLRHAIAILHHLRLLLCLPSQASAALIPTLVYFGLIHLTSIHKGARHALSPISYALKTPPAHGGSLDTGRCGWIEDHCGARSVFTLRFPNPQALYNFVHI